VDGAVRQAAYEGEAGPRIDGLASSQEYVPSQGATGSLPGSVADVLRSHAWMHAAEGVLYREAVLAAARRNGWPAHAVEESGLPDAGAALAALGAAAGRPWRRYEKDAARAALTLLPRSS